ncbi:hypothetical protein SAMN04488523_10452 [Sulfitobacter brevis]|uniref:Uncharacterized protein n=1 Tax=Sulfitobacter brevis TaxID=74348 RepID=A0A1I1WMY1_9RHOB|nr:hypothetical protein SAMN04488523_10452 [Sulfitobacter brevis]
MSGTSRSAISELEYIQLQFEYSPGQKDSVDEVGPEDRSAHDETECQSVFYDWIVLLAGMSVIYAIGYWISP